MNNESQRAKLALPPLLFQMFNWHLIFVWLVLRSSYSVSSHRLPHQLFQYVVSLSSFSSFIRGRTWLVNNPRGKLLNQSDRSSYLCRNQLQGLSLSPTTFLFWRNGDGRNDFRQETNSFFGKTWRIAKSCKFNCKRKK